MHAHSGCDDCGVCVVAACPLGHPKWEQPIEDEDGNKAYGMGGLAAIRCHSCNEYGHKASQCTNKRAEPAANTAAAGPPPNAVCSRAQHSVSERLLPTC
jgi:hypothetical protein